MRKISIIGVLIGGVADILATNVAAIPIVVYVMATSPNLATLPQAQQTAAVMAAIQANVGIYLTLGVLGAICSVLGGYVAALIAKRAQVLNGALSAYLCIGSGIWALFAGHEQLPIWLHILLLPLSPGLGAAGGYLRALQLRRRAQVALTGAA
jgi:hypothetical protein